MREGNFLTIRQVAIAAGVAELTVRRYIKRGVIDAFRDDRGRFLMRPDAPKKVREHLLEHGGPGGAPLRR